MTLSAENDRFDIRSQSHSKSFLGAVRQFFHFERMTSLFVPWKKIGGRSPVSGIHRLSWQRQIEGMENEIRRLRREYSTVRFEQHLIHEISQPKETSDAIVRFLNRLVPQPAFGIGVLWDVMSTLPVCLAYHGITEGSAKSLNLTRQIVHHLENESHLRFDLESRDATENEFARCLSVMSSSERRKLSKVWMIGLKVESRLVGILLINQLWPAMISQEELLGILFRSGNVLARRIEQTRNSDMQSKELESSREMLVLRSIADYATESPIETLHRIANRLKTAMKMDRVSLYLASRRDSDSIVPAVTSDSSISTLVEPQWAFAEQTIARHVMSNRSKGLID
ncbi:MAG: hypothetical protein FJ267_06110, partial [Planctomycetes bacterium]|nr:hypothetical protein [Planctomycetota bacterium]